MHSRFVANPWAEPPQPGLGGAGLRVGVKPGGVMNKLGAVLDEPRAS